MNNNEGKEVMESKGIFDVTVGTSGADTGFEGTCGDSFKTPFMKILQQLSPELKRSDPNYLEGAQSGMFINTATRDLHEKIEVVVLKIEHSLISWKPNRGGFVNRANKALEDKIVANNMGLQKWDADGNEVVDSMEFFCMNINDPSEVFILALSKAMLKHAKAFATRLRSLKADGKIVQVSWAGVWEIGLVEEKNEKGSWFTIGNTPRFVRFITKDEKDNFIMPAKEMLATATVDYQVMEEESEDKNVQY